MSEAGDDPMLEEYLERGTEVSRRYRELDAGSVPPELDRRVVDAARAAVSKPRTWVRWGAPIAVAASAVLVVSIVIETGVDEHAVLEAPGPAPQPPAVIHEEKPEAAMSQAREQEEKRAAERARQDSPVAQDAYEEHRGAPLIAGEADSPVMVVPVQPPAPDADIGEPESSVAGAAAPAAPPSAPPAREVQADTANEVQITSARNEASKALQRRSAASARPQPEPALQSAAPEGADAAKLRERSAVALPNPELWLESIRELRRDGKTADADREWQRFREVFPDYPVAEGDSARKVGTP